MINDRLHEEMERKIIARLETEKLRAEEKSKLWYDLVCAFVEETDDDSLVRRALDAVQQISA